MNELYLNGDYIRGYTVAIQDIQNIFDYIDEDLIYHKKRLTPKLAKELLICCLENRTKLREQIVNNGFIRWNQKQNKFEWYQPQI